MIRSYAKKIPGSEFAPLVAWLSTFYNFQLDWLLDQSRRAICNKSRRIGISHATAGGAVLWSAFDNQITTIISIGQKESDEVLKTAKKHAYVLESLGAECAKTVRSNSTEIEFRNGGRIIALPSSGGRSFGGNVFLDEYAYQEHATKVWDAAAAVTLLGWKLRVVSTPNGEGNQFAELCDLAQDPASGYGYHEIPLQAAIAEGYPVDMKDAWDIAMGDPRLFDQLFNCSFLDGNLQYIPTEYVAQCCVDDLRTSEGEYYAGLDIGRDADLTVLVVVRYVRGIRYLAHVEFMKRTDSDGLEAMVDRAFDRFKLRRLCIDATGLGTFPAERIKKKHSERIDVPHRRPRVECINFTPTVKEDLATGLYAAFTGKTVLLPKTDRALPGCPPGTSEALRKAVTSIRRIVTNAANIRYDAPRTSKGHADHAWSLGLALHACSTPNRMLEALSSRS